MNCISFILCLVAAAALPAKAVRSTLPSGPHRSSHFDNPFLSLQILPGWTIARSNQNGGDRYVLTLTHGRYVLAIAPLFFHASPVPGGRFSEIINYQPSVKAVMGHVDMPAGGFECSLTPLPETRVSRAITLLDLYTDPAKEKGNRYGCHFPAKPSPVWFASFAAGEGPEGDYNIALTYDSIDINALPFKDSPELARIFNQAVRMLQTLRLKPPVVTAKVVPALAAPGATVTIYGAGFALPGLPVTAVFKEQANTAVVTRVAHDGRSLTFTVPTSTGSVACQPGRIEVNGYCVVTPPGHIDINDCPHGAGICSIPFPPKTYHLCVAVEGTPVWSNPLQFTVTAPPQTAVSLRLLYPAYLVQPGDVLTLRGSGFTPTGNTVHIGSVRVPDLNSTDGMIRLPAPYAASSLYQTLPLFVSNSKGVSNVLTLVYR